jgi:hypothetical protein
MINQVSCFLLGLVLLAACRKSPSDCFKCSDPTAKNFSEKAFGDSTCCIYGKTKPGIKSRLDAGMSETSGLIFAAGRMWTHNDSGGDNAIYAVDTSSGTILQTVILKGVTNVDWEDIAQSDTHLYVADIGNNQGNRKNLKIYRFPLTALESSVDTIRVNVETISFSYADQTDFTPREKHNFDCEALLFFRGRLFLFTKNRLDNRSNVYTLLPTPGTQQAQQVDSFDARGLVTGADVSPSGKEVVLVGYNRGLGIFLWVMTDFSGSRFLSGNRKLLKLGDVSGLGQMEAICYTNEENLFFSSEKLLLLPARLYRLSAASFR